METQKMARRVAPPKPSRLEKLCRIASGICLTVLAGGTAVPRPSAAEGFRIEGTLVGDFAGGQLFAEQLVPLGRRSVGSPGVSAAWRSATEDAGSVVVGRTGHFEHRLPFAGRWRLRFATPDGPHVIRDLDWVEHHVEGLDIDVPGAVERVVRVADPLGASIAGARVRLSQKDHGLGLWVHETVTRGDGTARLLFPRRATAPVRDSLRVELAAPGFVSRAFGPEEVSAVRRGSVDVVLERGRPVDVVLQLSDQPVVGAELRHRSMQISAATTDEAGRARIWVATQPLESQQDSWTAQAASWAAPVTMGVAPRSEERRPNGSASEIAVPWSVRLAREACEGRVLVDGKPAPAASVRLSDTDALGQTDDQGRFCLPTFRVEGTMDLPPNVEGEATLVVDGIGISRLQSTWADRALMRARSDLRLTVVTVDEGGGPVSGARVRLSRRPPQLVGIRVGWAPRWIEATTNDEGRAAVWIARDAHVLEVDREGRQSWSGPLAPFPETLPRHELQIEMPPGTRHEGWVVDASDQPIQGASVYVAPMDRVRIADRVNLWPEASREVVTDEEGRFEIADHPAGTTALVVRARGFVDAVVRGIELGDDGGALGSVVLDVGFDLEGRVVDESGHPLAGVEVGLHRGAEQVSWRHRSDGRTTDAEGRFRFEDLAAEERRLWFQHADYVGDELVVQVPTEGVFDFVLTRGLRVPVSVGFDDGSRPVSAGVSAMQQDRSPADRVSTELPAGVGDLEGLRPGTYWVTVRGDQSDPLEFQARFVEQSDVPALERVEIVEDDLPVSWDGELLVVALPVGVTISGTVRGAAGELIENVSISIDQKRAFAEEGRFELRNLPPRQVELRAEAEGFVPHRQTLELERDVEFDIELERGGTLTGLVVDPVGEPVANVQVRLGLVEGRDGRVRGRAMTDAEGRYRLTGLAMGTKQVMVRDPRYMAYGPVPVDIQAGETAHDIRLSAGVRMFGRVVGLPDHMIGRASLELRQEPRSVAKYSPVLHNGMYEFSGLSPGPVLLRLGSGFDKPSSRSVQVPDLPEFEYDFELGRGSLRGVVLQEGLPQRGLMVTLLPEGRMSEANPFGRTGVEGDFFVEMLDEGRYELAVLRASTLLHREEIWISGAQETVIDLQPRRLLGVVRGGDGLPIHGAQLILSPATSANSMWDLADARGVSDPSGRFALAVAPTQAVDYDLRVAAQGFASQVLSVNLADTAPLDVVLERERRTLAIEWSGDRPPMGSTIYVLDDRGRVLNQRDNAGYGGGWRVPDVPENAASVVVTSSFTAVAAGVPGGDFAAPSEARTLRVRMSWPATGTVMLQPEPPILMRSEITVRLRDAAGRLVPAPVGGRMRTLRHWWLGTAPVATLPAGFWTLERLENGVVTQSATFQVVAGSRITTPFR